MQRRGLNPDPAAPYRRGMATLVEAGFAAEELQERGFIRFPAVFDARFMDSLLLRAHATLFRESADAREAVKSNGSLIHLADNPEYADKNDVLLAQLQADIDSTFSSDDTKTGGLGIMTDKKWESTLKVLKDQGVLKAPVEVKNVYSDAFLAK